MSATNCSLLTKYRAVRKDTPLLQSSRKPDEEYVSAKENKFYSLDDLEGMGAYEHTIMVGKSNFNCGEVMYLSVENGKGHAIVGTDELHEVEFDYKNGMIANITCDCWACGICKHGVAAVFALKSALEKSRSISRKNLKQAGILPLCRRTRL